MKIATVLNGKIHIKDCDSRLFQKTDPMIGNLGIDVLEGFVGDTHISILTIGMLVRPICNIGKNDKVTLAGIAESNMIQTIEESTSILYEYRTYGVFVE